MDQGLVMQVIVLKINILNNDSINRQKPACKHDSSSVKLINLKEALLRSEPFPSRCSIINILVTNRTGKVQGEASVNNYQKMMKIVDQQSPKDQSIFLLSNHIVLQVDHLKKYIQCVKYDCM